MGCLFNVSRVIGLLLACLILVSGFPSSLAIAEDDGNWKRGRIYYRMVCTACHKDVAGHSISPMSKTIAGWKAYFRADKHDASGRSQPALSYYASREYRESVKETNRVAAKFIDLPAEQLFGDLRAWVVHGAKDSDTPARCQ